MGDTIVNGLTNDNGRDGGQILMFSAQVWYDTYLEGSVASKGRMLLYLIHAHPIPYLMLVLVL